MHNTTVLAAVSWMSLYALYVIINCACLVTCFEARTRHMQVLMHTYALYQLPVHDRTRCGCWVFQRWVFFVILGCLNPDSSVLWRCWLGDTKGIWHVKVLPQQFPKFTGDWSNREWLQKMGRLNKNCVCVLKMCSLYVLTGFCGVPVPAMLPSDAEMKCQSSVLNGSGIVSRPLPAPIGLPEQLRLHQQQMQQQMQQRGVWIYLWALSILSSGMVPQ